MNNLIPPLYQTSIALGRPIKDNFVFFFGFTLLSLLGVFLGPQFVKPTLVNFWVFITMIGAYYSLVISVSLQTRQLLSQSQQQVLPNFRKIIAIHYCLISAIVVLIPLLIIGLSNNVAPQVIALLLWVFPLASMIAFRSPLASTLLLFSVILGGTVAIKLTRKFPEQAHPFLTLLWNHLLSISIAGFFILLSVAAYRLTRVSLNNLRGMQWNTHSFNKLHSSMRVVLPSLPGFRVYFLSIKFRLFKRLSHFQLVQFWIAFWSGRIIGITMVRLCLLGIYLVAFWLGIADQISQEPDPDGEIPLNKFESGITIASLYLFGLFDNAVFGQADKAKRFLSLKVPLSSQSFSTLNGQYYWCRVFLEVLGSIIAVCLIQATLSTETVKIGNVMLGFFAIKSWHFSTLVIVSKFTGLWKRQLFLLISILFLMMMSIIGTNGSSDAVILLWGTLAGSVSYLGVQRFFKRDLFEHSLKG